MVVDSCEGQVRPGTGSCASESRAGPHTCSHNMIITDNQSYAKTPGSMYKTSKTGINVALMGANDIHTAAMATKNFKFYTTL